MRDAREEREVVGRGRALEDREGGRMLFFLGLVETLMREWAGGREEERKRGRGR